LAQATIPSRIIIHYHFATSLAPPQSLQRLPAMVHRDVQQPWESMGCAAKHEEPQGAAVPAEGGLQRTASQVEKGAKLSAISDRVKRRKACTEDLGRTVSELSECTGRALEGGAADAVHEASSLVDKARKQARGFNEDLVEDMLVLDGLSGLASEDRSGRKSLITSIEAVLDQLEVASGRLRGLKRRLDTELAASSKCDDGEGDAPEAHPAKQAAATQEPPLQPPSPSACWASEAASRLRSPRPTLPLLLPLPTSELWRLVELPLNWRSHELAGSYELSAFVPALADDDFRVDLGERGSTLTLSGLCAPSAQQAEKMRAELSALLLQEADRSPQMRQHLSSCLEDIARRGYADMGRGKFGSFSQSFRLPGDVDVARLHASCREGVLRVTLPKTASREAHVGRMAFDDMMRRW